MNNNPVNIFFIFCLINLIQNSAIAGQIRDNNIDPISIEDNVFSSPTLRPVRTTNIKNTNNYQNIQKKSTVQNTNILEGVVGKSRFVRFDVPVKRISIANPEIADLVMISPKEMLINGKQAGVTSLVIWGNAEDPVFYDIQVQNDSEGFLSEIKAIAPNENLKVSFKGTNAILSGHVSSSIVRDRVANIAKAYGFEVVDLAESPTSQVMLEVQIVEASSSFMRDTASRFSRSYDPATLMDPLGMTLSEDYKANPFAFWGYLFDGTTSGSNYNYYNPHSGFNAVLKAAEEKGQAKILAQPKIMTANGTEASFNAGQEVAVDSGLSQTGQVSYSYKNVGINVKFKPTILPDLKRIKMEISPEVSEIDPSQTGKVGFKTRKVSTTVELGDSETLVIAGLYRNTSSKSNTQIPILGDLPIIGNLFKARVHKKDETELMIFVTPRIVDSPTESRI